MYKIEYYKQNAESWREIETRYPENENKLRANLYNLQKRGYVIQMVYFLVNVIEFEKGNNEDNNKRIMEIMNSYPEGYYFQTYGRDTDKIRVEVYPPENFLA